MSESAAAESPITQLRAGRAVIKVFFADHTGKSYPIATDTTAEALFNNIVSGLQLSSETAASFRLWLLGANRGLQLELQPDMLVWNVVELWRGLVERWMGLQCKVSVPAVVLKRASNLSIPTEISFQHPSQIHLLYVDALSHVLSSEYCVESKLAARLAAMQMFIQHGNNPSLGNPEFFNNPSIMESMTPTALLNSPKFNAGKFRSAVAQEYAKVAGRNVVLLKLTYMEDVRAECGNVYGACFFDVELTGERPKALLKAPNKVVLSVSAHHVTISAADTHKELLVIPRDNVAEAHAETRDQSGPVVGVIFSDGKGVRGEVMMSTKENKLILRLLAEKAVVPLAAPEHVPASMRVMSDSGALYRVIMDRFEKIPEDIVRDPRKMMMPLTTESRRVSPDGSRRGSLESPGGHHALPTSPRGAAHGGEHALLAALAASAHVGVAEVPAAETPLPLTTPPMSPSGASEPAPLEAPRAAAAEPPKLLTVAPLLGSGRSLIDIQDSYEAQRQEKIRTAAAITIQNCYRGKNMRAKMGALGAAIGRVIAEMIRKERANVPTSLALMRDPYTKDTMVCDIKAISLDLLILRLLNPDVVDEELERLVILTHHNFVPSRALLKFAELRFFAKPDSTAVVEGLRGRNANLTKKQEGIVLGTLDEYTAEQYRASQLKVLAFVRRWLTESFFCFGDSRPMMEDLNKFLAIAAAEADEVVATSARAITAEIVTLLEAYRARNLVDYRPVDAPASIPPKVEPVLSIMHINPVEAARQLTLRDHWAFRQVASKEFMHQAWCRKNAALKAPNLLLTIDRFNATQVWAATEVLRGDTFEHRAAIICRLLDIALACRELDNYNSLMAILVGLECSAIGRLQFTFELVPPAYMEKLADLKSTMSMTNNFKNYRTCLKVANVPAVPYLGLMLQDLTFIDDGNEDQVGKMVNVEKHRMTAAVVLALMEFQKGRYDLEQVLSVEEYLQQAPRMSADELYKLSLEKEPRSLKDTRKLGKARPIDYKDDTANDSAQPSIAVPPQFIDDLLHNLKPRNFPAKSFIIKKGDVGSSMFFIVRGVVEIPLPGNNVATLNQGAFFGEMALFLNQKRSTNVRARTLVQVLELTQEVCYDMLNKYPQLKEQFQEIGQARSEMNAILAKGGTVKPTKGDKSNPPWMKKLAGLATQ